MSISVFITGATGYIGGSILHRLLSRKDLKVTVLVKDSERGEALRKLGVEPLIASLSDLDLLEKAAEQADVVVATADSADNEGAADALIRGLEKRSQNNKRKPIYIHTSGSGVTVNFQLTVGDLDENIHSESPYGDINGVAKELLHRNIEIIVLEAAKRGKIETIIVSPSMIYGRGKGPFNQRSILVSMMINAAIKNKGAVYVNEGNNIWSNVHIDDIAELYELLLNKALEGKDFVSGYYFVGNSTGETKMRDIAGKIAQILHKYDSSYPVGASSIAATDPKAEELFTKFGVLGVGSNSRIKSDNARNLGWNPHAPPILDTIDEEVTYWLQKSKNN